MGILTVDIGGAIATDRVDDLIKTYALGSCVGVVILCPRSRVGCLGHIALPNSSSDIEKAKANPAYFADTGIPHMLKLMKEYGVVDHTKLIVKIMGGASINATQTDFFEIGKRNITAIKKIFWERNIPIVAEDVGKNHSRTVTVVMKTGKVVISCAKIGEWLL